MAQILHQVSTKSDAYSFGVLLIELLNGKKMFHQGKKVFHIVDLPNGSKKCYVEGQFENILDGIINNSIVDFTRVQNFNFTMFFFVDI
jgi:hypothetical protein